MTNIILRMPTEAVLLESDPAGVSIPGMIRVIYQTSARLDGWVQLQYIDEVRHALANNVVPIEGQTISQQDAAQYIKREGRLEFNLCGEMCAAYLLRLDLETLLQKWKAKPITQYHRIFKGKLAATTGVPDLLDMLAIFPPQETSTLAKLFACGSYPIMSPGRLVARLSEGWRFVAGVTINRAGRLKPTGTPHWIVIVDAIENGVGDGWVIFYDPYLNRERLASWDVFSAAIHTPHGVGVLYGSSTG